MSRIVYYLNGNNMNDVGIVVKSSTGLLELPDIKERKSGDWAQMHGKVIDDSRPYLQERSITLNCAWLIKSGGTYNVQSAQQYVRESLLNYGQKVQLRVHFPAGMIPTATTTNTERPLVYNVLQDKGISFSVNYSGNDALLTFDIKLIEPQPCKMVLVSKSTRGIMSISKIGFNPNGGLFTIEWGDGSVTYDVTGTTSVESTHSYGNTHTYYAIVSGDIALLDTSALTLSNDFELLWILK